MDTLLLIEIPLFVTGYTGWKGRQTIEDHLKECPDVAGILVIDAGLFVASAKFGNVAATGPWSLWGLISALNFCYEQTAVGSYQSREIRQIGPASLGPDWAPAAIGCQVVLQTLSAK